MHALPTLKPGFTPLAAALSSCFLLSTAAWAADGDLGNSYINGVLAPTSGPDRLLGGLAQGQPGGTGANAEGGPAGDVTGQQVSVGNAAGPTIRVTGDAGTNGTDATNRGTGSGGHGGGSVFGGISTGGAGGGGASSSPSSSHGGAGGATSGNTISLTNVRLTGADAGAGGALSASSISYGGTGSGGHGGGSVFGGISTGGAGGIPTASSSHGGAGEAASANTVNLTNVTLTGADAGAGGARSASSGGTGSGGHGGGSVFGGISTGGAGGYSFSASSASSNGGAGGAASDNSVSLTNVTLTGADAGAGGARSSSSGGTGSGGHGGGSVFGGISTGGAGGSYSYSYSSSNGGAGGAASDNTVNLTNVTLTGGNAGEGGAPSSSALGGTGATGLAGGSVFGGVSTGGAGGYAEGNAGAVVSAHGGAGGDVYGNRIQLAGLIQVSGSIYGGHSQGGAAGVQSLAGTDSAGDMGQGGRVYNNRVTLVGEDITIGGSIYGGWSMNGDGSLNTDRSFYSGNTLVLDGFRGAVQGIYNFEHYDWVLPKNVVNQDVLVRVQTPVDMNGTQHTVAMASDGQQLYTGDTVTLIDQAIGTPTLTTAQIHQGLLLTYDASLAVGSNGALVLTIDNAVATPTPTPTPQPAGHINPQAKALLEGSAAAMAAMGQGADMVSNNAMGAARHSAAAAGGGGGLFMATGAGSSRYHTGSHVDVRDIGLALGVAKNVALPAGQLMLGVFAEYGQSSYDSYNHFAASGEVRGRGNTHYSGLGLMLHMAGLGQPAPAAAQPAARSTGPVTEPAGAYVQAALRAGRSSNRFDSADLIDAQGVRGRYASKAGYASAMAAAGYVWQLDAQQALQAYGRYTWGKLGSDQVWLGADALTLGAVHSARLRLGTRYSYTTASQLTPYVGLAWEREFRGAATGKAYEMAIEAPSLRGSTGVLELGVRLQPSARHQGLALDVGLQGYAGQREGAAAAVKVLYAF